MKHLKPYDNSKVISSLNDIALDIIDEGFLFNIRDNGSDMDNIINDWNDNSDIILCNITPNKLVITETLYETVMCMIDYMKQNSFTINYIRVFNLLPNNMRLSSVVTEIGMYKNKDISTEELESFIGSRFRLIELGFIK